MTKRTTCDDVIHALLEHEKNPMESFSVHAFTVYEKWNDIERPLRGRMKLLKVWRAWGVEKHNVKFMVRKEAVQIDGQNIILRKKCRKIKRHLNNESLYEYNHGQQQHRPRRNANHCHCCLEEKYLHSRALRRLVAIVIENEKTLIEQGRRLRGVDAEIDEYESRIHTLRIEKHGYNYVTDAYMLDNVEYMDYPYPNCKKVAELCVQLTQDIEVMEQEIASNNIIINELTDLVKKEAQTSQKQVTLKEYVDILLMQEKVEQKEKLYTAKLDLATQHLEDCDEMVEKKLNIINTLEHHIDSINNMDGTFHEDITDIRNDISTDTALHWSSSPINQYAEQASADLFEESFSFDEYDEGDFAASREDCISRWSGDSVILTKMDSEMGIDIGGHPHGDHKYLGKDIETNEKSINNKSKHAKEFLKRPEISSKLLISESTNTTIQPVNRHSNDLDSSSDTGLSSLHSDEVVHVLETLV